MSKLAKGEAHRALADVEESIAHARECAMWIARESRGPGVGW